MTDDDVRVARREIADTLVRALERRHELIDAIVQAEDYDAAVEQIAALLGTSPQGGEAVLRLSFDRLTRVSRRRIAAELEDLNNELSFTMGDQSAGSKEMLALRPFDADSDRDIFAARTDDVRAAGDGSGAPAGDLDDEIRAAVAGSTPKRRRGWSRLSGRRRSAWCSVSWPPARSTCGYGFIPRIRKHGYGTAALRKSRSEMAAYFPAVPLVVRAPAAGP